MDAFRFGVDEENAVDIERVLVVEELAPRGGRRDARGHGPRLHLRDVPRRPSPNDVIGAHLDLDRVAVEVERVAAHDLRAFDREARRFEQNRRFALAHGGSVEAAPHARAAHDASQPGPEEEHDGERCDRQEPFARDFVERHPSMLHYNVLVANRVEMKCLSPLAWRYGWLKGIFVFLAFIAALVLFQARSRGFDAPVLPALGVGLALVLAVYLWSSKVTLLEDGLRYERYGFEKFVPYSRILETEAVQRLGAGITSKSTDREKRWTIYCAIRLHLEGGGVLDIGTGVEELKSSNIANATIGDYGSFGAFDRKGWELKRALDARIADARHAPEPATPVAEGLMRGEKTAAEWLAAVQAAAPATGDAYRGGQGTEEALWRVLEDEASPREARAGAALALRSSLDQAGRDRMRVVVETCESPKLRVAIETALDEEAGEPRLLHALEQASLPREES